MTAIDDLVDMFIPFTRSSQSEDKRKMISEMIATEIWQLIYSDEKFAELGAFIESGKKIDPLLLQEILESSEASDFLKQVLSQISAEDVNRTRSSEVMPSFFSVNTKTTGGPGHALVVGRNIKFEINIQEDEPNFSDEEDAEMIEAFEINILDQRSRSGEPATLIIKPNQKPGTVAMLIEELVDGEPHFYWKMPDEDDVQSSRNAHNLFIDNNSVVLISGGVGSRGKGKVKRFFVKLFRLAKKEIFSGAKIFLKDFKKDKPSWENVSKRELNRIQRDKGKTLFLMHGLLNTADGTFKHLLDNKDFKQFVIKNYKGQLLAGEFPTARKRIYKAEESFKKLGLKNNNLRFIAASWGTLASRTFLDFSKDNKLFGVGGTHFGTPIADREHMVQLVNRLTNLSYLVFGSTLPFMSTAVKILGTVAKLALKVPGIADQDPNSDFIRNLNRDKAFNYDKMFFVGANYQPTEKIAKRLFDRQRDRFIFKNQNNDVLAPTRGAIGMGPDGKFAKHHLLLNSSSNTNHFSYWKNDEVLKELFRFMKSR